MFDRLLKIHDRTQTSIAPSYLPMGDVSGKVVYIYYYSTGRDIPKSLLGFSLLHYLLSKFSRKVWSTFFTTQQAGIYPKAHLALVGFAIYRVSLPAPIYWRFTLCVYSPCANILAFRVLNVNLVWHDLNLQHGNSTIVAVKNYSD